MKPALTVAENLAFWRDFCGSGLLGVGEALETVGLGAIGDLPYGYLSTGQKRRAAIARLLVSRRPLWLLDEPTAGLDAESERGFSALMEDHLGNGGIIVAATHVALGIERVAELRMGEVADALPSPLRGGSIREAERGGSESSASSPPPPGSLRSPPSPQGGG